MGRVETKMNNWNTTKTQNSSDVNTFYNHYMEKHASDSGILLKTAPPPTMGASLIVVDMQNDFIYTPKAVVDKFGLNVPIGRFCVQNGDTIIKPMVDFIDKNVDHLTKIIYTRDAHPIDHCSFFTNGGPFPPHCVANHIGAALHPEISAVAKKYSQKSAVIFKGCAKETDSFGADKYPSTNDYMMKRQVGKCCDGLTADICSKNTGGRYLREDLKAKAADDYPFDSITQYTDNSKDPLFQQDCPESTFDNMSKDLGEEFKVEDLLGDQTQGTHTIYVVGLAADMCVKDTAVNIMKHVKKVGGAINGVKINVVVIQDLTRYVFLPIQIIKPGGVYKNTTIYGKNEQGKNINYKNTQKQKNNIKNFLTESDDKDVNRYIFQYTAKGARRLTKEEVANADLSALGTLDPTLNPNGYAAFTSPIKDIIQDYKDNDVKLIMTLPILAVNTNLSNSGLKNIGNVFEAAKEVAPVVAEALVGGRRRYKTKTRKNKKNCWPKMKGGKKTRKPMGHKKGCKCIICKRR